MLTCVPRFDLSNTDHIMDVVQGSQPAPRIDIICPHYPGPGGDQEQHIIYSVSREEFRGCRVATNNPRIVATCTEPSKERFDKS